METGVPGRPSRTGHTPPSRSPTQRLPSVAARRDCTLRPANPAATNASPLLLASPESVATHNVDDASSTIARTLSLGRPSGVRQTEKAPLLRRARPPPSVPIHKLPSRSSQSATTRLCRSSLVLALL